MFYLQVIVSKVVITITGSFENTIQLTNILAAKTVDYNNIHTFIKCIIC